MLRLLIPEWVPCCLPRPLLIWKHHPRCNPGNKSTAVVFSWQATGVSAWVLREPPRPTGSRCAS